MQKGDDKINMYAEGYPMKGLKDQIEKKFSPGPWYLATGSSWRRILDASNKCIIEPTNHPVDNHPDLSGLTQDIELAAASRELLDVTVRLLESVQPISSNLSPEASKAYSDAKSLLKKLGLSL